jgi:hypothetical protein
VRATCGGHDRINDDFRARLPNLDVLIDATRAQAEAAC